MVNEAKVLNVVPCHHVLIEFILVVEASVDSFSVKFLKLVTTNHSRTLISPFLDIAVATDSCLKQKSTLVIQNIKSLGKDTFGESACKSDASRRCNKSLRLGTAESDAFSEYLNSVVAWLHH